MPQVLPTARATVSSSEPSTAQRLRECLVWWGGHYCCWRQFSWHCWTPARSTSTARATRPLPRTTLWQYWPERSELTPRPSDCCLRPTQAQRCLHRRRLQVRASMGGQAVRALCFPADAHWRGHSRGWGEHMGWGLPTEEDRWRAPRLRLRVRRWLRSRVVENQLASCSLLRALAEGPLAAQGRRAPDLG